MLTRAQIRSTLAQKREAECRAVRTVIESPCLQPPPTMPPPSAIRKSPTSMAEQVAFKLLACHHPPIRQIELDGGGRVFAEANAIGSVGLRAGGAKPA